MEHYELENHFIQFLKKQSKENTSFERKDWIEYLKDNVYKGEEWKDKKHLEALDILYSFFSRDVISFAYNWKADLLHYLRITDYGKMLIEEDSWLPYDPDGYIAEFKKRVPNLDDLVYVYLGESVQAYHRYCLLSAITMLGVASECLILELMRTFGKWLSKNKNNDSLVKAREKQSGIYVKYKNLMKALDNNKNDIPDDLQKDMEIRLGNTFNYIRMCRNEAGHPTGETIGKRNMYARLQDFDKYASYIKRLIDNFKV